MDSNIIFAGRAFSKQAVHFDEDDLGNPVLQQMRQQIYDHADHFIKTPSKILELNAGTGIDAMRFVSKGHTVHATDVAEGMISQIENKIEKFRLGNVLSCQQVSYDSLDSVDENNFDFIFSNFGGLNCIDDLSRVSKHFTSLLKNGGHVTLVIMPKVCLWEMLSVFKGNFRSAFRRFKKGGVKAHLEGEYFQTYYHSLSDIEKALGSNFKLMRAEGLGALGPQPHRGDFPKQHPGLYSNLMKADAGLRNHFPFNRWADHIIVTFRYQR